MKTHWLHGRGPNKEVHFKVEIDEETDCKECIHNHVCMHKKERLCLNYEFGTSEYSGCDSCLHRFTRWCRKEPLPCFHCEHFIQK
jgi:hypothetical protein